MDGLPVSIESAMNLEARLQQPVEDNVILKELLLLRTRIENHTRAFYHKDNVNIGNGDVQRRLGDVMLDMTRDEKDELIDLLVEPRSRAAGIQIVLARTLIGAIDFRGASQQTLLPQAAVHLMSVFNEDSRSAEAREYHQLALARWRLLCTFLLLGLDGKVQSTASDRQVQETCKTIDNILGPFVDEKHASNRGREERIENLTSVIRRTANLGMLLFSQPTTWEFDWELPRTSAKERSRSKDGGRGFAASRKFVLFPGAWKTGDTDGKALPKPILQQSPEIQTQSFTSHISKTFKKTFQPKSSQSHDPRPDILQTEGSHESKDSKSASLERSRQPPHLPSSSTIVEDRGEADRFRSEQDEPPNLTKPSSGFGENLGANIDLTDDSGDQGLHGPHPSDPESHGFYVQRRGTLESHPKHIDNDSKPTTGPPPKRTYSPIRVEEALTIAKAEPIPVKAHVNPDGPDQESALEVGACQIQENQPVGEKERRKYSVVPGTRNTEEISKGQRRPSKITGRDSAASNRDDMNRQPDSQIQLRRHNSMAVSQSPKYSIRDVAVTPQRQDTGVMRKSMRTGHRGESSQLSRLTHKIFR